MAVEIYANQPSTTVSSGGTTAPASGTTETWTVASSASFPAASNSATPPTQFHVTDTAVGMISEVIAVTNVSGTTWSVTRGAESTTPLAHTAGFTIQQVGTSGGYAQFKVTEWLNVKTMFGAAGNGSTDDTTPLQTAITGAAAAGGGAYLPPGTYKISSPLTAATPFSLLGAGRDASVIQLANGVNDYAVKFTQGTGIAMTGARFADLQFNGNAANQTAGGGISAVGAVECNFERLHFTSCFNWGLALQAIPGGAFGHNNRIFGCTFDNAAAAGNGGGIWTTSNDENLILGCDFQFLGGTVAPSGSAYPVMLYDQAGLHMIEGCTFVGSRGGATNVLGVRVQNATQTRIVGCTFDGVGGDGVWIAGTDCVVTGNEFTSVGDQAATAGVFAGVHLEFGTARNIVTSNNLSSSSTNGKTGYLIREESSGGSGANVIEANALRVNGTIAVAKLATAGAASIVRSNIGYNPVGAVTAPGIPASTTPLTNPFNVDASVFVTGGTVSAIAVNGATTGATTGQFWVPAAGTIALTYTVAPTWVWIGL